MQCLPGKNRIHLECDIRATENNPNGFAAGEWISNLTINYTLIKLDTGQKIEGHMMPMVANDGPHYGDNIKMLGVGKYKVIYKIDNPLSQGFGRHTDRETGVRPWFRPFEVEWEFTFLGAGKKADINIVFILELPSPCGRGLRGGGTQLGSFNLIHPHPALPRQGGGK